jgi:hypothetical protein
MGTLKQFLLSEEIKNVFSVNKEIQENKSCLTYEDITALTMKTAVFCYIKTQFVPHRRHVTSPLMCPAGK